MRLSSFSGFVSAAVIALVAGCGGRVAVQNSNEGTGGSGTGGAGGGGTGGVPPEVCDLSLITAGTLPRRGHRNVESAAIAASANSYTIAYVETDPASGQRNSTLVNLTDSGQIGGVKRNDLPGCASAVLSHGSAVTFSTTGSHGLAAFALRNCGSTGAGSMFISLSANGSPSSPTLAINNTFSALSFGPHALAGIGDNRYAFVYLPTSVPAGGAQLATLTGHAFDGAAVELFSAQAANAVGVSTSSGTRAVLGHLASGKEVLQTGAPEVDAGTGNELQLGTQPWGAMTTIGTRVAVVLPTADGVRYRLFESGQQVHQGALQGSATPAMADVAARGDHLIVVGAHNRSLDFYRVDNATTNPTGVQVGEFANGLGTMTLPPIKSLAIAAARGTVAVVMAGNGTAGHWALFSCKN